ncbi:MAG: ABC transporter transmembrane domain-containing protein [Bacillota bacterium]|nr:ABC transporter transmembrane domain-containing protein [Bacillota bacterium]
MFSVLKKLSWFFKLHWKRYVIAVSLLLIVDVLEIFPPKLIGIVIDDIQNSTLTSAGLFKYITTLLVVLISNYMLTYGWMYNLFGGAFVVEKTLRSMYMSHLLRMTPTFYEKNRTGDLMARATNDLKSVSTTAGFGILTLADSSVYMLFILFTMGFMISWKLTLASIIPLPFMALSIKVYGKRIHERFTEAQDAFGDLNDHVLESISGVRVIRAYVKEKIDESMFSKLANSVYQKNVNVSKIDALFEPTIKILTGMSYLIGIGYGAFLVFHQDLTLGGLVSFNVYLGMMIWPMFAIGELINVMQRGNASLDRVNETLFYQADVRNSEHTKYVSIPKTIQFKNVCFQYPKSEMQNLKDINLTIKRGTTIGIVGKTGSGKTTIIKQLLRQYPFGMGEITVSGIPLHQIPLENSQKWIGYVPQDHVLFSRTVRENILFGDAHASNEDIDKSIDLAAFRKDLDMLPNKLETLVGEKGVALSGGQKQRISIARALIRNPEILLLDDSLSAVDAKTEAEIIRNIRSERKEKTTVIIAHRLSAVMHADCIIVLNNGEIVEEGTHNDLMKHNGWYQKQFERQQVEENLEQSEVVV